MARLCHAILCLLAVIGLVIEYVVTISGHPGELASRTVRYLSFFTILSNMVVAVVSAAIATGAAWAEKAGLRTATTLYIVIVAVIFQLLLAALIHLTPLGWWGNMLVHQLVPGLWVCLWLGTGRHGGIGPMAPLAWLIYPLVYGIWTIVHGALSGFYPYPFLDVARFGGLAIVRNMAAMALFFALLGYALRWIDARLGRRWTE